MHREKEGETICLTKEKGKTKNIRNGLTSGGSMALSTASDMMKKAMNSKNRLLPKPTSTSARTYPYENLSLAFHLVIIDAARPNNRPVQSKNMWNASDMRPGKWLREQEIHQKHCSPKCFAKFNTATCRKLISRCNTSVAKIIIKFDTHTGRHVHNYKHKELTTCVNEIKFLISTKKSKIVTRSRKFICRFALTRNYQKW